MFKELTLDEFFNKLASKTPTPGGGTVGALCGALAASLGVMASALSQGEKYASVAREMQEAEQFFLEKRDRFLHLADEDANSFEAVMQAYRLPKDEPDKRREAIQLALKEACRVPLEIGREVIVLIPYLRVLLGKGNRNALSDVGTALSVSKSGLEASIFNVRINLQSIKDEAFKKKAGKILDYDYNPALAELDSMLAEFNNLLREVN